MSSPDPHHIHVQASHCRRQWHNSILLTTLQKNYEIRFGTWPSATISQPSISSPCPTSGMTPTVVDPAKKVHSTRGPDRYVPMFRTGLAAPGDPKEALSWTNGNISTSLTDSGLWTAFLCQESRKRMLLHFQPYKTSPLISKHTGMPVDSETVQEICDKPTASVNMEFTHNTGERQYLIIRPSTNLICLEIPKNSKISYGKGGFD